MRPHLLYGTHGGGRRSNRIGRASKESPGGILTFRGREGEVMGCTVNLLFDLLRIGIYSWSIIFSSNVYRK